MLPLVPGDRYVLRDAGRQETVGGGEVLDVAPWLSASKAVPSRSVDRVVEERGWVDAAELGRLTGAAAVPTLGRWVVSANALADEQQYLRACLERAGPLGLDVSQLSERQRVVLDSLDGFVVDERHARAAVDASRVDRLLDEHPYLADLQASPFSPPAPNGVDRAQLRAMERRGLVIERDGVWFAASTVAEAARVVSGLLSANPEGVRLSAIREALGTTRRYAIPLVAHLDAAGATRRRGDVRIAGPRPWRSRVVPPNRVMREGATMTVKLTEWTACGGCAAKWAASPLGELVRSLALDAPPPELLVGLDPFDDAAVYRLTDDLALVSTTDFFPPLVDDPSDFGAVAAANACSDVFAMGGRVVLALNIAAFPENMSARGHRRCLRRRCRRGG